MNAPALIYALRWLVVDTFRQTLASRVFWIMLSVSTLCIVFAFSVTLDGGLVRDENELYTKSGKVFAGKNDEPGKMTLLFGAFRTQFERRKEEQAHLLLTIFASWVAGTAGILLTLVWTAGFLPEALEPSAASVLLAKPVPRWLFLAGKFLGVLAFVAVQAAFFFVGTWLGIGLRTGVWFNEYLLGIPLFLVHFATIFSFSVLLAATFRSTMACILGSVLFWIACYATNYAYYSLMTLPTLAPNAPPMPGFTMFLASLGYWLLPKPADLTMILEDWLDFGAEKVTLSSMEPFASAIRLHETQPALAVASSLAFCVVMIALAGYQLTKTDY